MNELCMASEKKWRLSRTSNEQQFEEENTRTKSNVCPFTDGNRMEAELAQPLAKNETSRTILMRRGRAIELKETGATMQRAMAFLPSLLSLELVLNRIIGLGLIRKPFTVLTRLGPVFGQELQLFHWDN